MAHAFVALCEPQNRTWSYTIANQMLKPFNQGLFRQNTTVTVKGTRGRVHERVEAYTRRNGIRVRPRWGLVVLIIQYSLEVSEI